MIAAPTNPWAAGWSEGHAPPKDQTVAEWCAENVFLIDSPIGAKYEAGGHSDDILNDLQDPDVYESCTVGHTGMGKSAILECATCYIIAQQPGPTGIIGQTDDTVREWVDTRAMKAWQKCEAVSSLLPTGRDRHDKKKDGINFRHMPMFMGGANISNTQEKSLRYTLGDEVWAWKQGMLGEFLKRHHDRWNRKSLKLAQGGVEDDDWHRHVRDGLGFDRAFRCPSCEQERIYTWSQIKYEEFRDGNGEFDWPKIYASVHRVCGNEHCDEKFEDSPRGRTMLAQRSFYLCRNNASIPGRVTRYVPAMANPRIELKSLVKEWLLAEEAWKNGDRTPRRQFIQKRLAQFWVEKVETPTLHTGGEQYTLKSYNAGEKWEGEFLRDMTIDVQKGHFWCRIRAWKIENGAKSRLIWAGKATTWQGLFDLQERFGIENNRVFIDGRYEIDEIVRQIYIHCGEPKWELARKGGDPFANHWNILIGEDNDKGYSYKVGPARNQRTVWRMYSQFNYHTSHRGQRFRTIRFSNLKAKDALAGLMELEDGTFGVPVDAPPYYLAQMKSETKRELKPGVWRWEKIKDHIDNHLWDTEMMGIVSGSIVGILKIETGD